MNSGGRGQGAGGRGQPAVSDVELRTACGERRRTACGERRRTACGERRRTEDRGRRTEDGVSAIKNRSGMTLVEVMLAATILGIMSIVVIHALFYPRFLALSGTFKQQAILAGTDALEQIFSQPYNFTTPPVNPVGKYVVNGRAITNVTTTVDTAGTPEYKRITVTVSYPGGGTPIVLETLRYNVN